MRLRSDSMHKIKPKEGLEKEEAVKHIIPPQQAVVARVLAGKLDPGNAIDAFQALQGPIK